MQQIYQQLALPVACGKCGQIFDLSYDVSIDESMMQEFVAVMKQKKLQGGLLCWDCR